MNYMPSGIISKTNCKECIFAIYSDKTQIGCEANRIEKFGDDCIEAYDEEKEFFVIKRLCNLYRNNQWNNGTKDLNKAQQECSITFDILINCDNINDIMLDYIKQLLINSNYKNSILLFYKYDLDNDRKQKIKNIFFNIPNIKISAYFNKIDYIYNVISHTQNSFHIILNETNYNNIDQFIYEINQKVNYDLLKGIIFKHENKIAISTLACKMLYPNLYLNFDNNYPEMERHIKNGNLLIEW